MLKPFSRYLKAVEEHLSSEHHPLLRNGLYLAILDWYTDGIEPIEAAARIRHCGRGINSATEHCGHRSPEDVMSLGGDHGRKQSSRTRTQDSKT